MRVFVAILGVFILSMVVSFEANSQSDQDNGRRVFGADRSSGPNIYNSPGSSYGTGGPISLKQILQGRERAASGDPYAYRGGRVSNPYSINPNDYSLDLNPDRIRASRERRDFLAQQQEEQTLDELGNPDQFAQNNSFNQFNPTKVKVRKPGRGTIYNRRDKNFDVPKKVFRSIY